VFGIRAVPDPRPCAIGRQPAQGQLIKARRSAPPTWQIAIRVVLPQIMPRLYRALPAVVGPGVLILISAEGDRRRPSGSAIASSWCAAIFRWTSSLPYRRLDHAARLSHGFDWHGWRAAALPGPMRDGPDERDLAARCLGRYDEQIVLERVNLQIAAGTFLSVVGPSGAGKSTFLRLILGQEGLRAARS